MSSTQSTESRGGWLWRKMAAIYGTRFYSMWEGVRPEDVQAEWSVALRGVSRDAIMRGIGALYHAKYPPTLPEFIDLCKPEPAMYRNTTPALEAPRTPPEQAREQLAKIREVANDLLRKNGMPIGGGIRWAYRLLQSAADGEHITQHQIDFAKTAIESYNSSHGRNGTREPGDDDEVTQ